MDPAELGTPAAETPIVEVPVAEEATAADRLSLLRQPK